MPKTRRYAVRFYPGQKIRTGWQLKAARILAGLKRPELAGVAGLHVKGPPDLHRRAVVLLRDYLGGLVTLQRYETRPRAAYF